MQLADDRSDLVAREHDRQARRALGAHDVVEPRHVHAEHIAIEEQSALSAWFCVDAATWPSVASELRYRVTSVAPMSLGWRRPWKRTNRRIHPTYVFSVFLL